MAIVQVSRITSRKGLIEDLPQPLAGAELGWAVDERRLFIGNGTLAEGAPVVGNTEVLTEFSDILSFATEYTYKGAAAGYTVQTGATSGSPVSQSLQSRLDSYAVITDFGAVGDGVTDNTAAINHALQQLYCIQNNTQIRRSLFFPAGTYVITDTINLPPYALLYGEGTNSSIISLNVQEWAPNTAYASGVLVYYTTGGTYYRSIADVPANGIAITNISYWDDVGPTPLSYIMRTSDSLQQVGVNIAAANGATPPQNIGIVNMAFETNQEINGILIEDAENVEFKSISISGPLTTGTLASAAADTAAIRFASTSGLICTHITIDDFAFSGFTYGTATEQQVKGVTFANGYFDTLYQGVYLGGASVVNGGPTGVKITNCVFDNIYVQGIVMNNVSLNASGYNVFYDVGNHFQDVTNPASSIISIDADNNASIGDMFQRSTAQSSVYPRISLYNISSASVPVSIGIDSAAQIQAGSYVRETGTQATLTAGVTNSTLFTKSSTYIKAFSMQYTIVRETSVRTGTMVIVNDADDSAGDGLSWTDDYVQNSDTDISLSVTDVGATITVQYTSSGARGAGKIYYSLTHLGLIA